MAVYGLTGPWTGWLIGRAPHLVAEAASELTRPETPQRCPNQKCRAAMVRRPGAWKCYRREEHEETIANAVLDNMSSLQPCELESLCTALRSVRDTLFKLEASPKEKHAAPNLERI